MPRLACLLCFQKPDVGDSLIAKFSFQPKKRTCYPLDHTFHVLADSEQMLAWAGLLPTSGFFSSTQPASSVPGKERLLHRSVMENVTQTIPKESSLPTESSQARPSWFAPLPSFLSPKLPEQLMKL